MATTTDLLTGRDLDVALAEVRGWAYSLISGGETVYAHSQAQADRRAGGYAYPPYATLDLIAAVEEPLREAGWWQRIETAAGMTMVEWGRPRSLPMPASAAPTEKEARGNAAYRALLMLTEAAR